MMITNKREQISEMFFEKIIMKFAKPHEILFSETYFDIQGRLRKYDFYKITQKLNNYIRKEL